jgi:hypothetical protein
MLPGRNRLCNNLGGTERTTLLPEKSTRISAKIKKTPMISHPNHYIMVPVGGLAMIRTRLLPFCLFVLLLSTLTGCGFIQRLPKGSIIDHLCTNLNSVPVQYISAAKADLHIAYGHTSHGSQLTSGMSDLDSFMGGHGIYTFSDGGAGGALDLREGCFAGASDLGNPDFTAWEASTRTYLTAHPEINVIIWSWCGQVSSASEAVISSYLNLMSSLEIDFPTVQFVYMTGHLDGTGLTGNLHERNEQIRAYCRTNHKWLYDFADIESYDPDGVYYLDRLTTDACSWDANGNGIVETQPDNPATLLVDETDPTIPINGDRNWASEWQNAHPGQWYACGAAHSVPLNANRKAFAAWWLWARLAGWNP